MRVLTITTLYPNAGAPNHGVFVENRLADFRARHNVDLRVIAPVPWFPFRHGVFGKYGAFARTPKHETRRGAPVQHPRYFIPPKVGMTYAAFSLERRIRQAVAEVRAGGFEPDIIDAHYLYPDGVAAARVAAEIGKPIILTARGSDVTEIPAFARQRRMILSSIALADAVVCVASALRDELIALGAPAEKLKVLRNGVDLELFRPQDPTEVRAKYDLSGKVVASIGHLIPRKGHDLVIGAVGALVREGRDVSLLIVGEGPERESLGVLAASLGVAGRVRFAGTLPHESLASIYSAADVLALGSSREGWPNVLLEAMACGTPAVATPVWGCGEAIASRDAGRLARDRSASAIADAIRDVIDAQPSRAATRAYAEGFSWSDTSQGLHDLFSAAIERTRRAARVVEHPIAPARQAALARKPRPKLIVTVDTEEIFDWRRFAADLHRVADPADLEDFQSACAARGARPLYFLSHPIILDAANAAWFRDVDRRGLADLGLHLHQWATPPDLSFVGEFYSWQMNLPDPIHRAKLAEMGNAFERAFGRRARSHRAGRYGISRECYPALAEAGVAFDFSPSPAFDFSAAGGPDFSTMSNRPFRLEIDGAPDVFVTPASGAHGRRGGAVFAGAVGPLGFPRPSVGRTPLISSPLRLSPEGASLQEMIALARHLIANRVDILTFCVHSTSFTRGANQYAKDPAALVGRTDAFIAAFVSELGGEVVGLEGPQGLAAHYRDSATIGADPPGPDTVKHPLSAH